MNAKIHSSVLEALGARTHDSLIGTTESNDLDFKRQPYFAAATARTGDSAKLDEAKLELAKDVSAMANVGGGIIVIGGKTVKVPELASEKLASWNPFPKNLFIESEYRSAIESHIFPVPKGIAIHWYETGNGKGFAAIVVPPQHDDLLPFLVTKVVEPDGTIRGNMLGYFERQRDQTLQRDIKQFHGLLQAGQSNFEILERINAMEANLKDSLTAQPDDPVASIVDIENQRIARAEAVLSRAVAATVLNERPVYALMSTFVGPISIPAMFVSGNSALSQLLRRPPRLRDHGFQIDAGDAVQIVAGERLQALQVESNRVLELWRDGTAVFVGPGDHRLLCWGNSLRDLVVNPIVLMETVSEFCCLVAEIQKHAVPDTCGVKVGLRLLNAESLHLGPGAVSTWGPFQTQAQSLGESELAVQAQWVSGVIDPAILGYRLVAQVYRHFGHAEDQVPYLLGTGEGRRIDFDYFRKGAPV